MIHEDNGPVFPVVIFPENIRKIIDTTHEESCFPVNYIAAALFFAASVAVGNYRTLEANSFKAKAHLFMALLGSPGSGKTHPINFAIAPFLELDKESIKEYQKKLNEWRKAPDGAKGDKPKAKQLRFQDITMEAITKVLGESKRGIFVFVDELRGWISSFNKYNAGGGDREQWLSLYSGVPITVNRKGEDDITFVADPYVSVIGGIQPGILPKLFGGENMDNGFFYRMLFVNNPAEGEPMLWKSIDLPSGCEEEWKQFLTKMLDVSGYNSDDETLKVYSFNEDAWEVVRQWQNDTEIENSERGSLSDIAIFRKTQDYCLRFCLIIHAMREAAGEIPLSTIVDENTALRATILANYFFESSKYAYKLIQMGGVDHGRFFDLLNALNTDFTSDQAVAVGKQLQISRSTVFRYLRNESDGIFLKKTGPGKYSKI